MDIYLDQNHWIPLSRAYQQREDDPALVEIAALATEAVQSSTVRLPISRLHLIEATKRADDAQRQRLIESFIHYGRGWILRPAEVLHAEELGNWAAGRPARASTAMGRGLLASYSDHRVAASRFGVSAEEVADIDAYGDTPAAWHRALTSTNFRQEAAQVHAIAQRYAQVVDSVRGEWAKQPPLKRKVLFAEGLLNDTVKALHPIADDVQVAVDKLQHVPSADLPTALSEIPTLDVLFTLSEGKTRDLCRPTDPNDLWDLGFLAAAIPYCDVVVTEKYWSSLARSTKLDQKYSCQVLARTSDLKTVLS